MDDLREVWGYPKPTPAIEGVDGHGAFRVLRTVGPVARFPGVHLRWPQSRALLGGAWLSRPVVTAPSGEEVPLSRRSGTS